MSIEKTWIRLSDILENMWAYGVHELKELRLDYIPTPTSFATRRPLRESSESFYHYDPSPYASGYEDPQCFSNGLIHLPWYPIMHYGEIYLFSSAVHQEPLILHGFNGEANADLLINAISNLYNCERLNARAVPWTDDNISIIRRIPDDLVPIGYTICLRTESYPVKRLNGESAIYINGLELRRVAAPWQFRHPQTMQLYSPRSRKDPERLQEESQPVFIYPLVHLPKNVLVNISELGKGPLPLRTPSIPDDVSEKYKNILREMSSGNMPADGTKIASILLELIELL